MAYSRSSQTWALYDLWTCGLIDGIYSPSLDKLLEDRINGKHCSDSLPSSDLIYKIVVDKKKGENYGFRDNFYLEILPPDFLEVR